MATVQRPSTAADDPRSAPIAANDFAHRPQRGSSMMAWFWNLIFLIVQLAWLAGGGFSCYLLYTRPWDRAVANLKADAEQRAERQRQELHEWSADLTKQIEEQREAVAEQARLSDAINETIKSLNTKYIQLVPQIVKLATDVGQITTHVNSLAGDVQTLHVELTPTVPPATEAPVDILVVAVDTEEFDLGSVWQAFEVLCVTAHLRIDLPASRLGLKVVQTENWQDYIDFADRSPKLGRAPNDSGGTFAPQHFANEVSKNFPSAGGVKSNRRLIIVGNVKEMPFDKDLAQIPEDIAVDALLITTEQLSDKTMQNRNQWREFCLQRNGIVKEVVAYDDQNSKNLEPARKELRYYLRQLTHPIVAPLRVK